MISVVDLSSFLRLINFWYQVVRILKVIIPVDQTFLSLDFVLDISILIKSKVILGWSSTMDYAPWLATGVIWRLTPVGRRDRGRHIQYDFSWLLTAARIISWEVMAFVLLLNLSGVHHSLQNLLLYSVRGSLIALFPFLDVLFNIFHWLRKNRGAAN